MESFVELMLDGAHWLQEVVFEAMFFGVEILILDRLLHRHRGKIG